MDARFAMWVHGNTARPEWTAGEGRPLVQVREWMDGPGIPWSDIVGLPQGYGMTFRGKAFQNNWFHFSIPAPVIVPVFQQNNIQHSVIHLERVFVLYKVYPSPRGGDLARIQQVDVWDGARARFATRLVPAPHDDEAPAPTPGDLPPDPEPLPYDRYGGDHHMDIHAGWNAWTITDGTADIRPLIRFGVGISVFVHFSAETDIRFAAAGADFLLELL